MDSTFILLAGFCMGLVFGYGVRALISRIRREKVRRLRQSGSFPASSRRISRQQEQTAATAAYLQ